MTSNSRRMFDSLPSRAFEPLECRIKFSAGYSVTQIPLPVSANIGDLLVSRSGRVFLNAMNFPDYEGAFVIADDGQATPMAAGALTSGKIHVDAVSDNGQFAILSDQRDTKATYYRWHDDIVTKLIGFDASGTVAAWNINDTGIVVGSATKPSTQDNGSSTDITFAAIWAPGSDSPAELGILDKKDHGGGLAIDVNNSGVAIGRSVIASISSGLPTLFAPGGAASALIINGDGFSGPVPATINEGGRILGTAEATTGDSSEAKNLVVWGRGEPVALKDSISYGNIPFLDMNNSGQVIASLYSQSGFLQTYIWNTPVSEPYPIPSDYNFLREGSLADSGRIVSGLTILDPIDSFATVTAGKLTLNGTDGTDRLVVKASGKKLVASLNAASTSFPASSVNAIDVFGGDGDDAITLGSTITIGSYLSGGGGNDTITGSVGDDALLGGSGKDSLTGGDGDDRLSGSGSPDIIHGGEGNDRIYGDDGDDYLYGEGGVDRIYGGNGSDHLYGSSSNDKMYGEAGDDTFDGGKGADLIDGGLGNDFAKRDGTDNRVAIEVLT